jgi:hypothetical protein
MAGDLLRQINEARLAARPNRRPVLVYVPWAGK